MNYPRSILLLFSLATASLYAQQKPNQQGLQGSRQQAEQKTIIAYDFESPLNLADWWVDNKNIGLSQCDHAACDQLPGSGQCLRIQWDSAANGKPYTWMTDIKIDTSNTWLSFSLNTATGDSIYLQFVIFTKGEKDKWGSHAMIGFKSPFWKMIKIRLSSLRFDNWGKGNIAEPDFRSIVPARIEIGLRSPAATQTGKIDLRVDNILLTNYEP